MSQERPSQSDQQTGADRHQIFEQIALERLRSGSDTSKPVQFLPLPVRLTTTVAFSVTALGVLWACFARVPVQVNGIGAFAPDVQVSSAIALVDGVLAYQVSGVGPNKLSTAQQKRNDMLAQYWGESWSNVIPDFARLNKLALAALAPIEGQSLVMPESLEEREKIDDLTQSAANYKRLFFKNNTMIARIDNALAMQELDSVRSTVQPKLQNDQSIASDRIERAAHYRSIGSLLDRQGTQQRKELQERQALFDRLRSLWSQGYVSTTALLQEQSVINGLKNQVLQNDRERVNTEFSGTDQQQQAKQTNVDSLQTRNQLQAALVSYIEKVYITAPQSGMHIISRSIRNGMAAKAGDEVFTYSADKPTLPQIMPVFVDAANSQQLTEGMSVIVTPKGISRAEYGGIIGVIEEVGKLPLPPEGVAAFAGGRTLSSAIQQVVSTPYLVRVKLQLAEPAYCQQMLSLRCYQWSTRRRPPFPVRLGTLADIQINTSYKRPIEFVMPALRQAIGLVEENR